MSDLGGPVVEPISYQLLSGLSHRILDCGRRPMDRRADPFSSVREALDLSLSGRIRGASGSEPAHRLIR